MALLGGLAFAGCKDELADDNTVVPPEVTPGPDTETAVLYNWPECEPSSTAYSVRVNGTPYFVFPVPQTNWREEGIVDFFYPHIVMFDIKGEVQIDITSTERVHTVKIRPERANIAHTRRGNTISITLTKPQQLSVEINDDLEKPLLIFASPPETEADIPDKNDPNVLFYESGQTHTAAEVLPSNATVYIAPGAVVYGYFKTSDKMVHRNIRITGRGILSGTKLELLERLQYWGGENPIAIFHTDGVFLEGITLVDCKNWCVYIPNGNNVTVRGVKCVSNTGWEDGIDVASCTNVLIEDCFVRAKDDCFSPKAYDAGLERNLEDVVIRNCIIWNGNHGFAIKIGPDMMVPHVRRITFENIDIIHAQNCGYADGGAMEEGAIGLWNDGIAIMEDIVFRNIYIEDAERWLFIFSVYDSTPEGETIWWDVPTTGRIRNVLLENIHVTSTRGKLGNIIGGMDADRSVDGVTFRNLFINGEKITGMPNNEGAPYYLRDCWYCDKWPDPTDCHLIDCHRYNIKFE